MAETSSRHRSPSEEADPVRTKATANDLGAQQPGAVWIVSCRNGTATVATDVTDIAAVIADPENRIWIDLASPDHDEIRIVADALGLHPLIAEDIAERNQRAKVETFDEDVVHIVLFALAYPGEATASEIDLVLGSQYLLTVHDGSLGSSTTAALRFGVEKALNKGPDFLLYALYVSIVNDDLSRIMKRLTRVTVILAGIGAVAGIFGMSEAGNAFNGAEANGFWLVTGFVILVSVGAAALLHRID